MTLGINIMKDLDDSNELILPDLHDIFQYVHIHAIYKLITQFIVPITLLLALLKYSRYF